MRIIITGGAGFIGSHVADSYLAAGHEVVVVDSLWAHGGGRRDNLPAKASFVHLDIRDPGIERVFREFAPDIVSHHAAQHSVAISTRDPQLDAQVNVLGLINVLENAVKAKVKKVIFASSGATYGEPAHLPADESTPQHPESPYAITKMVAEYYLRFYKAQHGLDYTALRYGNVYGPRQDPNGEAGVISIFIGKFLARQGIKVTAIEAGAAGAAAVALFRPCRRRRPRHHLSALRPRPQHRGGRAQRQPDRRAQQHRRRRAQRGRGQ